jgi:hypothetical protein
VETPAACVEKPAEMLHSEIYCSYVIIRVWFFIWFQKGFLSGPANFWGKIWSRGVVPGVLALSGEIKITSFDETKNEEYYEFHNKKN